MESILLILHVTRPQPTQRQTPREPRSALRNRDVSIVERRLCDVCGAPAVPANTKCTQLSAADAADAPLTTLTHFP